MHHVVRDAKGNIASLHREAVPDAEVLPLGHPDIHAFMTGTDGKSFSVMDADLVRVLEDLIDVLLRRNVFCITDLPLEAQVKLFERRHFRENLQSHSLALYVDQIAQGVAGVADALAVEAMPDPVPLDWHNSDFKL